MSKHASALPILPNNPYFHKQNTQLLGNSEERWGGFGQAFELCKPSSMPLTCLRGGQRLCAVGPKQANPAWLQGTRGSNASDLWDLHRLAYNLRPSGQQQVSRPAGIFGLRDGECSGQLRSANFLLNTRNPFFLCFSERSASYLSGSWDSGGFLEGLEWYPGVGSCWIGRLKRWGLPPGLLAQSVAQCQTAFCPCHGGSVWCLDHACSSVLLLRPMGVLLRVRCWQVIKHKEAAVLQAKAEGYHKLRLSATVTPI